MKSQTDKRIDGLKTGDGAYTSGNGISISGDVISAKTGAGLGFDNNGALETTDAFSTEVTETNKLWWGSRLKRAVLQATIPNAGGSVEILLPASVTYIVWHYGFCAAWRVHSADRYEIVPISAGAPADYSGTKAIVGSFYLPNHKYTIYNYNQWAVGYDAYIVIEFI